MQSGSRAHGRVGAIPENIAAAVAYITFIPAIVFLALPPYNQNRFVRLHSFQCLFFWVALALIGIALKLVGFVLLIIPVVGNLLLVLMSVVVVLAALVLWLVLIVKALQGEAFKIPVIGDLADNLSASF